MFLTLMGSLNYQNNLGLLFTFFFVSVALVAMHHCWFNLLGLAVQAHPGPAVFAGDAARFEIILRNQRARRRYDLRVLGGLSPAAPVRLESKDQVEVRLLRPTDRRGYQSLSEAVVETRHPMGLFRAWSHVACQARVLVYPRPAGQAPVPQTAGGQDQGHATAEGSEDFLGPREYRLGDSPRHLDWKALARERGLVVKQFGGDLGRDLWIDWDGLRVPDVEHRIRMLCRQVIDAGEAGLRFGLRLPGREVSLGRGEEQVHRCLSELALYDHGQTPGRERQATA